MSMCWYHMKILLVSPYISISLNIPFFFLLLFFAPSLPTTHTNHWSPPLFYINTPYPSPFCFLGFLLWLFFKGLSLPLSLPWQTVLYSRSSSSSQDQNLVCLWHSSQRKLLFPSTGMGSQCCSLNPEGIKVCKEMYCRK